MGKILNNRKHVVWLLGLMIVAGAVTAQAVTINELLAFQPAGTQLALGFPSIADVEKNASPILDLPLPYVERVSTVATMLGSDTLSEGLAKCGVNVNAPAVAFLHYKNDDDVAGAVVLTIDDADALNETLSFLLGGMGEEIALPNDISGHYSPDQKISFFLRDNKFFLASNKELVEQLATRTSNPAVVKYGKEGNKDEVVALTRFDIIEESGLLTDIAALGMFQPLMDTLKEFSDEVLVAIGEKAGKAYVRLAAHDMSDAPLTAPAPLKLNEFLDPQAPVALNLRLTPELINVISMTLMKNEDFRQAGGYLRIASGMLDDELAISFSGMKNKKIPEAIIAVNAKNSEGIPNLLKMLAKIEEPSYKFGDNDVYVYANVSDDTDLHLGLADKTLIVTPDKNILETAMGRVDAGAGESGINAEVLNQGVYGFLTIDGSKASDSLADLIPANFDLSKVQLNLTLGIDGSWREIMLSTPAGFNGIASIIEEVM
ncbi:MAG: hypothetical protein GX117_11665 [Candidatus Hydrogenedentes bacterium]|nr:hypothetical protein [Candidatus Hydrogenedentota bacterium]